VAAYVIVGLGCEVSYAKHLVEAHDLVMMGTARGNGARKDEDRPRVLNIQEQGGITRTVEAAVAAVH
jgi:altronate hydrolase